ncbi:MOSC domain-containing protein YiiM [Halobacillus karajensis]|uniref:6-N-hydroxylaminopurine resistance protein n=1 Tax=Halobacillus karajensis TaxID=195088 RepID=A0A024P5X5_9BACI|nr:MOSC domain-containing protein [Halobacillus karajensis]CDQ20475.1 6-N-hydroxylaminopurine resistance protein [Halobacillus karajensis]CDQ24056.1 6-N-hydroxylaminopurine resistance protein [Halobacillus karajensis]CDQ27534.1 6-N-hydroxylaminopurine resistance protein [Halobacillus karajensis]SEH91158.1 MOSC domain-containing protein YiiM [Halobacillus karajensis]
MNYKLLSLNVGRPETYETGKGALKSAYRKTPVDSFSYLSFLNFEGDEQADKKNHGGRDKAVCLYPAQHYRHWETYYEREFSFPSFGENLTVEGIDERDIHIGDIFQLGEAVLQVSEPRKPCYIIARTHGIDDFPARVMEKGYTGFYLRVLSEGKVDSENYMKLVETHPNQVTVADVNEVRYHDRENREKIKRILAVEPLAEGLKQSLKKRL